MRLAALAALLGLALLNACSRDRPAADSTADGARPQEGGPVDGGTAVLSGQADMEKPMPLVWQTDLDSDLSDVMYMGLLRGAWRDGRLAYLTASQSPMAMAWLWEYTGADSASIRFRLRSGLRWSDGQPLTARDVVWSYTVLKDSTLASPRQEDVALLDSATAENDSTVTLHFRRRYPEMLFAASMPVAPEHVYRGVAPGSIRTHPSLTDPVAKLVVSGPFKVGEWRHGASFTLVRNPLFKPQPHLDRIVFRVIPEPTTRIVELENGTVDFARPIAFDQVPGLRRRHPRLRFEREQRRFMEYVAYNPAAHPAFADPQVRRALGMAVDVPGIIRALHMEEFTEPAAGPYSPVFRDLQDPQLKPLPHDPAAAARLLDERGWRDSDGDGVRDRDGKALRFTLLTTSGNQRRADVTQIIQQQWKAIGVAVELRTLEFNAYMDAITHQKFESALGSWGVALSPDLSGMWGPTARFNITRYTNPQVQELFTRALQQPTAEAAAPIWREAAERIVQDQPYTWLYYYDGVDGVSDRLRGMRVDTFGAFQNAWEWWIPRDRQGAGPGQAPAANDTGKGKRTG